MKIKTEKIMNLPQLIDWAWKNGVRGKNFPTDQNKYAGVYFATNGDFMLNDADFIKNNNTFTVEVEEEVTEDTEFKRLVCINDNDRTVPSSNFTIRDIKDVGVKEFHAYIDGEFKLIWTHEKGLVG